MLIPHQDLIALTTGESVIGFVERGSVFEGDEVPLEAGPAIDPQDLKDAYHAWIHHPVPTGEWIGIVEAVHPVTSLDSESGAGRHIHRTRPDHGDIAIFRVYGPDGAALGDEAYAAIRTSVDGAIAF
jgi:hypothetical protein